MIISEPKEITDGWIDSYMEEISENLRAIAEFNRIENVTGEKHGKYRRFYTDETKENIIELVYILFDGKQELIDTFTQYKKEMEDA